MASWGARIRPQQSDVACISPRAARVLEETLKIADTIPPRSRATARMRRILRFRFQRLELRLGIDSCEKLSSSLARENCSVKDLSQLPANGVWNFGLLRTSACKLCIPGKTWCVSPGCPACKKRGLLVLRGATQLACRLLVLGNSDSVWLLRATHNSDDVRHPFEKRRSVRTTARRLVRGSPEVDSSVDQWPGTKTPNRPEVALPDSGPQAESVDPQQKFVLLNSDLSKHARKVQSPKSLWFPPMCVIDVVNWERAALPPYPLRALGLGRRELELLHGSDRCADWWGEVFEMGRAPSDSKFCAVWHALFESLAPI